MVMRPFCVREDVAVVVHVDLPDQAGVALAGVHEVPDHPARLVLVDPHGSGAPGGSCFSPSGPGRFP